MIMGQIVSIIRGQIESVTMGQIVIYNNGTNISIIMDK